MLNRMSALLLGLFLCVQSSWAELPLPETREENSRCDDGDDCTPLGISVANGVVITWITFDDNPGQLVALDSNNGRVFFENTLVDFLDADGSFAVASFEETSQAFRIDYANPDELFTAASPDLSDEFAAVFGVNASGAFSGTFRGASANAYVPGGLGAIVLPQPRGDGTGAVAIDISENSDLVCGVSLDAFPLLRPTLWRVDENLAVTSSIIIAEQLVDETTGQCNQVANTNLDPEGVAISAIAGVNNAYFLSTGQIAFIGGHDVKVHQDFFVLRDQETGNCFASTDPGRRPEMVDLQTQCVDSVQDGNQLFLTANENALEVSFEIGSASLLSSVLPASRSVSVGSTATAFATVINAGTADAQSCSLALMNNTLDATFFYQVTDPASNTPLGEQDTPVDIPAGQAQSFVFGVTPNSELIPTEVAIDFRCESSESATSVAGLNTLLLSGSAGEVADVVALATTQGNDGIVRIDQTTGAGAFSVASVNVGANASIQVSADLGDADIPVQLSLCQTNPTTGVCTNPATPTQSPIDLAIGADDTPTFAVFASSTDTISLDPANSRVFVRFQDESGASRGATSVAVTTK